jgi:hypothetical protein
MQLIPERLCRAQISLFFVPFVDDGYIEKERPCSGVTDDVGLSYRMIVAWKIPLVHKFVTFFTRLRDDCHVLALSLQQSAFSPSG